MGRFPGGGSAITTILVVGDVETSVRWYRDILGADVTRTYGSSAVLEFLGTWLLLVTSGDPTPDKPDVSFVPPEDRRRVSHSFTIRVEDCDAAYRELVDRGAEFLTPPLDRGEEIRCFFRDPDGHLFEISQV
ncbi:MAG: VOC family protein [Thermoleophilia bacterium]|nr:VOC family protein [Thermoleophilia bacterium]MDH3724994.1 VOC family protein [Thermoleophilia bacterium]